MNNISKLLALSHLDWENPEDININWFGKEHDNLKEILKTLHPDCDTDALAFLFHCYDYLENQIIPLLDADADMHYKVRWILTQYLKSLLGGIPDQMGDDELDLTVITRRWNQPRYGTTDEWLNYVRAMYVLYMDGPTEKSLWAINYMQQLHQKYLDNKKDQ